MIRKVIPLSYTDQPERHRIEDQWTEEVDGDFKQRMVYEIWILTKFRKTRASFSVKVPP